MRQRLISAAVLVPVVVIVFLLGDPWLTLGIALLAALAGYEASRLARSAGLGANSPFVTLVAALAVLVVRYLLDAPDLLGAGAIGLMALVVVIGGALALRHPVARDGFLAWFGNVGAALYAGLLAFVVGILVIGPAVPADAPLRDVLDPGRVWLLILVLTVWSFDSFAYLAGRYHGRGRFMKHISPNKTWSGVIGGSVAATLVATLLVWAVGQNPLGGIALGLLLAVTAQAGDLAESMLKRAAGAKDSGALIPGHGGILDRIDSFLFAAPAMFVALTLTQAVTGT